MPKQGWHGEPRRHGLAARGIETAMATHGPGIERKTFLRTQEVIMSEDPYIMSVFLIENRHLIGKAGTAARKMGEIGEKLAAGFYVDYDPHETWTDAADMTNGYLVEVKTLHPLTTTTPIMPEAKKRKIELAESTGKPLKIVMLSVQQDKIKIYEHVLPPEFYIKDNDAYVLRIKDAKYVGYVDRSGNVVREV